MASEAKAGSEGKTANGRNGRAGRAAAGGKMASAAATVPPGKPQAGDAATASDSAVQARPADLAIGIDFGGSGIKGAIVDVRSGALVVSRIRVPTPQPSVPREVLSVMDALVGQLCETYEGEAGDTFPIGVGVPSAIRDGAPLTAANIDGAWVGFPAERELSLISRRVVAIGNDADVAGLAEVRFGAGRGHRGVIIVLTIGTGIGSGLFVDGRLVPNTELGHLELRGKDAETRVSDAVRDRLGLSWEEWAVGFDEYLHLVEKLFWPDLFILGGGASKRADKFLQFLTVKTPVVPAELRNNAGIVGGALIAHERRSHTAVRKAGEPMA